MTQKEPARAVGKTQPAGGEVSMRVHHTQALTGPGAGPSASCRCTYDAAMRTTVDLPPDVHERAKRIAVQRHQSLSATLADLTIRGLASLGEPATVTTDPISGLPALTLGHRISAEAVAEALDDE